VIAKRIPRWMFRMVVDATSVSMHHGAGGLRDLPEHIRTRTALDYRRTAGGVYTIPNTMSDLNGQLAAISLPTLIVWGNRDQTLSPASFSALVNKMPHAEGKSIFAGHVPHQSNPQEFNTMALDFLRRFE